MNDDAPKQSEQDGYRIGENLYGLSVHELEARIAAYHEEITRLERERVKKAQEKQAADLLFKKN